jgi:type III secretion protein Q
LTPRLVHLPRVGPSEAKALQALVRRAIDLPIRPWPGAREGQSPARLSLQWVDSNWGQPGDWMRSRLEWSGAQLCLDVPPAAAQDWARSVIGATDGVPLPEHWRRYGLQHAVQWAAAALTGCGRGLARVVETDLAASAVPESLRHTFELRLESPQPDSVVRCVLHTDSLGLMMLASLLPEATAHRDNDIDLRQIPLRGRLCLGWTDLTRSAWRDLAAGDVVFIGNRPGQESDALVLLVPLVDGRSRGMRSSLRQTTLTILSEAFDMSDSPPSEMADEQQDPLLVEQTPEQPWRDQVKVRLSFDVGHRSMTMAELEGLQPGEVLELDRPLEEAVTIRANGTAVGSGRLVDVDGRLGVQVVQLGMVP